MVDEKTPAGLRESRLALDFLSTWVGNACPGGPWKALEPLGTIGDFLSGADALALDHAAGLITAAERVNAAARALTPTSAAHVGKLLAAIEGLNQARARATRSSHG